MTTAAQRLPAGRAIRRWLLAVLAMAGPCGCTSVSYYKQAIDGQLEIFRKQRPSEAVIADAHTDGDIRRKLALVSDLRAFAQSELALPAGDNYTRYADLGREHVVWTVFAAPEFSLQPREWRYPVVGKLSYRGYFREDMAAEASRALAAKGYDVFVGGVDAYSTLGWFSDPVLNTFIDDPDVWLAELVFHELTHRKLYIAGETDFNEAMATAVAEEGVRRWLRAGNRSQALRAYEIELQLRREVYRLIDGTRQRLDALYRQAGGQSMSEAELRRHKRAEFARLEGRLKALRARWGIETPESHWFEGELNNAHLSAMAAYHALVPMFEALLAECDGDLDRFFAEARRRGNDRKAAAKRSESASRPGWEPRRA